MLGEAEYTQCWLDDLTVTQHYLSRFNSGLGQGLDVPLSLGSTDLNLKFDEYLEINQSIPGFNPQFENKLDIMWHMFGMIFHTVYAISSKIYRASHQNSHAYNNGCWTSDAIKYL